MSKNFIQDVLKAFKDIYKEIGKGSSEYDVRYRFVKYFIERVLGFEPKYVKWEKKRADLTIVDENDFAVIKIETKKTTENINKQQYEEQAFKYKEETTKFIGLTNFLQLKIWEIGRTGKELKINLDFSKILRQKKTVEKLSSEEKSQILFLNNLTKENLFSSAKYQNFDESYARIDITKESGFKKLIDRLDFIVNNLLMGYTLKAFGEYKEGYNKYCEELSSLDKLKNNSGYKPKKEIEIKIAEAKYRKKMEEKYKKYIPFNGFNLWKLYSGKNDVSDEDVKEIFCKETIYVLLNKLLFIRICEDKNLLPKNISNGGIEELRKRTIHEDKVYKEILDWAFNIAGGLYAHFYETGILDWFRTGDSEFNQILNKVLWMLNQFNFGHIDRDILGNLYEKYLPSRERKKLGEFYTPVEIIDYILTSVGYTYSYDIENKDLLDPACGSGGFLVRAARRFISRYLMKFGKTNKRELRNPKNWRAIVERLTPDEAKIILDEITEHIYGFDINPFACHIAEMNMLFQIIDLYQKVREKYKDYKLKRFKVYRTDSLEKPELRDLFNGTFQTFLEEQEEIEKIKNKKFDFVVGNPPYVRAQLLPEDINKRIRENYKTPSGSFDLYIPFIERGIDWLKDNGKFGFINPNLFLNRNYGKELRKFLLENTILQIIDFGDSGVFKDVTNYPCILIVQKKKSEDYRIKTIVVYKPKEKLLYNVQKKFYQKYYKNEYFSLFEVSQKKLGKEQWKLIPEVALQLFNKIKDSTDRTFLQVAEKIYEGFITGANDIFFVTKKKASSLRLEKNILKPVPKGRNVRRWKVLLENRFVIYPHEANGKPMDIKKLKSEYPNTYEYFKQFKEKLEKRKIFRKTPIQLFGVWFPIIHPKPINIFNQPKIITPNLATENNFAFDEDSVFLDHDCYGIILKDKRRENYLYILGLLNSRVLEFYLKQISPYASGKYYRYMTGYLEKLPIKLPETTQEKQIADKIKEDVDKILNLHKNIRINIDEMLKDEETEKLYNLPGVSFSIEDKAKIKEIKIDKNRIYIDEKNFIEIRNKKIRDYITVLLTNNIEKFKKTKDIKNSIYNIEIPKSDTLINEIIKKGNIDQSALKNKINSLEEEINALVYKLYGLTEEEIRIVEASVK